jgi:DNA/RNA endonuclease G (NUC1)
MLKLLTLLLAALAVLPGAPSTAVAAAGFERCPDAFPADDVQRAPQRLGPAASTADSVALCYRAGDTTFFAVDYDTRRLTANWVAHRLEDSFGEDGCKSAPRRRMACYFGAEDVERCARGDESAGDPFHADATLERLSKPRLGIGAYSGTGHDRGHLAPNQSFSGHICGAYQTFTMANMAPQLADLNRGLWADLEEQVLFWAVKEGPLYVITGTMFTAFPAEKFKVIKSGIVDRLRIVVPNARLKKDAAGIAGKIVKPTGFYKVIFRPGRNGEPDRAIAFLVPHTDRKITAHFSQFVARVDVVEKASGFAFSMPSALKAGLGQRWWLERKVPGKWTLRAQSCPADAVPDGWLADRSRAERVAACTGE